MPGIEQEHDNFRQLDRLERVADRELLCRSLHPHLAPQAGGVEQPEQPPLPFKIDGDGVAGDSGFGAGDHAFLAENGVDERRLADIWTSHYGDAQGMNGILLASLLSDLRAIVSARGLLDEIA